MCKSVTLPVQSYFVIMPERLQQGGEVLEVDLLESVSHRVDQTALLVPASRVPVWLHGVHYTSNTCEGSRRNIMCVLFFCFFSGHMVSANTCSNMKPRKRKCVDKLINFTKFIWRQENSKSVIRRNFQAISFPEMNEINDKMKLNIS